MRECIFCQIIRKEIPVQTVYEDEEILAFKDIQPKAKVHLLIIPKEHLPSLDKIKDKDKEIVSKLLWQAKTLAEKFEIDQTGFKIIINTGKDGGQFVPHLHFHLVGGEELKGFIV